MELQDPGGREERVALARCAACGGAYFDVVPYTRAVPWKLAAIVEQRMSCHRPQICRCRDHLFMQNVLYARSIGGEEGMPWATEERVREALGPILGSVEPALALARRVHRGQVRDDGVPYLKEHVFPVTVEIVGYLRQRGRPDVALGAATALTHDVLEDLEWADPPIDEAAARRMLGTRLEPLAHILAKSTLPTGLTYIHRLREAPELARIVKVFDRLNNLRCVHKSPEKASRYRDESRRDYLPLAWDVDPELGERMAAAVDLL